MSERVRDVFNRHHPTFQQEQIGDVLAYAPVVFTVAVTADARDGDGTPVEYTIPFDCRVIGGWVECTAADSDGTLKVTDGTDDVVGATVCAVDEALTFFASVDDSKASLSAGDTIEVEANQTGTRGIVRIMCLKA